MRSLGKKLYPPGYGVSPRAAALQGSQFTMKAGDGTAARVFAASAPVAVLHANSFSSIRIIPCLLAALAASTNFAFIAARYGPGSSRRQKSKQRTGSVWKDFACALLRSRACPLCAYV